MKPFDEQSKIINIVVPCRNAPDNMPALAESLINQDHQDWKCYIVSDNCESTYKAASQIQDPRFFAFKNHERQFALKNIYNTCAGLPTDARIAIIDGDDRLCNNKALELVNQAFNEGNQIVWTANKWDDRDENSSGPINMRADPYDHPWVTSHMRCFKNDLLMQVPVANFQDNKGHWFPRGYDQALMLPMLHLASKEGYKVKYIDEVCYLYCHKGSSTPKVEHTDGILEASIVATIRDRGYLDSTTCKAEG